MRKDKYLARYATQFFHNLWNADRLRFLIFFVTSQCNCRCGTCFYWKGLEKKDDDLSLDEIEKISATIGPFQTLLLSGGEPFLRDDLRELCKLFIKKSGLSVLAIPTNCTLTGRIVKFAEEILSEYPHLVLAINPSLDGLRETHDAIRGQSGVFDKVVETVSALSALRKKYPKLEVVINTVITDANAGEIEPLMDFVFDELDCDYHEFELLRGEPRERSMKLPPIGEIKRLHRVITKNQERYLKRNAVRMAEKFAIAGLGLYVQKIKERVLAGRGSPMRCTAGRNIGVIEPNGDVRLCELLPSIGNLRKANYDFPSVWNSAPAAELRKTISATKCACTHVCFIKLSSAAYMRSLFYLTYHYLIYRIGRGKT